MVECGGGDDAQSRKVHPKRKPQMWKPLSRWWARRLTLLSISASRFDKPGGISRYIAYYMGAGVVESCAQMSRLDHRELQIRQESKGPQGDSRRKQSAYEMMSRSGIIRILEGCSPTYSAAFLSPLLVNVNFVIRISWLIIPHMFFKHG